VISPAPTNNLEKAVCHNVREDHGGKIYGGGENLMSLSGEPLE
jgi:hypothetical protein